MKGKRYWSVLLVATLVALSAWCARLAFAQGPVTPSSAPLAAPPSLAATVTLNPVADTYVNAYQPNAGFGVISALRIGGMTGSDIDRALIRFDLSGLPPGQLIQSATLRIYLRDAIGDATNFVDTFRITEPWGENTASWANQPAHDPLRGYSVTGVGYNLNSYYEWDATQYVREWYAGLVPNYGLKLISRGETGNNLRFFDSQQGAVKPQLVIMYQEPPDGRLAYIYKQDLATAQSFKTFVETTAFSMTLIRMDEIEQTDLSVFRAIVIADDSGALNQWGTPAQVAAIMGAGKPILGLGEGGYAFFGQLGLGIGWPNGWHGSQSAIAVPDPYLSIFYTPNAIPTALTTGLVNVYKSPTNALGLYLPSLPAGTLMIGQEPADADHFILAQQKDRFLLWGFSGGPGQMTADGQALFINALYIPITATTKPTPTATPTITRTPSPTPTITKTPVPQEQFAYIYSSNLAQAGAFKVLCDGSVRTMDLIPMSSIPNTELSRYRTIVIGPDTAGQWDMSPYIGRVNAAGRPILGMGRGGLEFFAQLGLGLRSTRLQGELETAAGEMRVLNPDQTLFSEPELVTVPRGGLLPLFGGGGQIAVDGNSVSPRGLLIGAAPDQPNRYLMMQEQDRFFFWGFEGGPQQMNDQGRRLFLNALYLPIRVIARFRPTPTPTQRPVNLRVDAIEITQAIQDLQNTVPLVANKRTYARVHVRADNYAVPGVLARFTFYRGTNIVGSLTAQNPGGRITVLQSPDRRLQNDSFYIEFPPAFIGAGYTTVCVELNPDRVVKETSYADNWFCKQVPLSAVPPVKVVIFNVIYQAEGKTYMTPLTDILMLVSWLRRAYPVPGVQWSLRLLYWPYAESPGVKGCDTMNALLAAQRALDGNPAGWRYYALVSDAGGFMRGCAAGVPGYIASGPTGSGSYGWDGDGSYGDWYGGHELGHTYGRAHAEFCGAGWGAAYPYPDGAIGGPASEPDRYYGWDIETLQVYTPYWKDVMTYCPFEWISNFTYEGIRSRLLGESAWSLRETEPAASEYLAIVGNVDLGTNQAALGTLYRLRDVPAQEPPTPSEDWAIALLNRAGGVLARYPFTPKENSETEAPGKGLAQISEMIPWDEATARISVQFRGQEVAGRTVSAHTPSVQLLYPNGGETLDQETALVRWQGSDADQDALTYALQYSADGGQNWQTLASELLVTQWVVSTAALPGSNQALFRVIASDGVNTAQDQSDRVFRVPGKPPQALIISPQAQMALTAEQQLSLVGEAYDLEDGLLPDQALKWSSNLQGALGVGAQLAVNLTPGVHTITLSAQDSDGQSGVSTVQVSVTARGEWPPAVELPLLLKSR